MRVTIFGLFLTTGKIKHDSADFTMKKISKFLYLVLLTQQLKSSPFENIICFIYYRLCLQHGWFVSKTGGGGKAGLRTVQLKKAKWPNFVSSFSSVLSIISAMLPVTSVSRHYSFV